MPKLIQVPEVTLRVMSLNAQSFFGAVNGEGNFMGKNPVPEKELEHHEEETAKMIAEFRPHIINLQEIDKCSARTYFKDQTDSLVQRIARITGEEPYNYRFGSCIDLDQKKLEKEMERIAKKLKVERSWLGRGLKRSVPFIRELYEDERFEWWFEKFSVETKRLPPGKVRLHFGNSTLVRPNFPIKDVQHEYFFSPGALIPMYLAILRRKDERKSFLRLGIDYHPPVAEKIPLYIINTHFENNVINNRVRQAEILYNKLAERSGAHKILAGDFNDNGEGILEKLISHPNLRTQKELLEQSDRYATYPTWEEKPKKVYDAILASKFLEITTYEVLTDDRYKVSDHYAVVADIKINHDLVPKDILKQMLAKSGQMLTKTP